MSEVFIGMPETKTVKSCPETTRTEGELAWQALALCAQTDPETFFPEKARGSSARNAKKICTSCEVRTQCLAYALANNERFGIWGGLNENERRKLKRRPAVE